MFDWNQKVVAVTGGSDGFGKALARAYASRGATVCALARDEGKLQVAAAEFSDVGLKLNCVPADVTNDQSMADAVGGIAADHGRIDVWVNNVGKSIRASVLESSIETYADLMALNFYSVVRCTNLAMPQLQATSGSLVNIGSLASKTGWPRMAPYAASKHALAAYTHQLRLEGPSNVHVLHVCPGPIKRPDAGKRYDAESKDMPSSARQPGAGAKMKGLEPEQLAQRIVRACENRRPELVVPGKSRILFAIAQLSPFIGDWLLNRFTPDT